MDSPRRCAQCGNPMPPRPGERPASYRNRRYCSGHCSVKAQHASGLSWAGSGGRVARSPLMPRVPPIAIPRQIDRASERDAIAAYIAEKGVTKVPPAFCAPSEHAAGALGS